MSDIQKIKWQQFLTGNHEAYSWLYKTYIQTLYSYGTRFTPDNELIKDSIQEVFTTLWKSRSKLPLPDNVKVYLMISLKNCLIRHLYKSERFRNYDSDEIITFSILEPTVEEEYIDNEEAYYLQQKVKEILSILTPRQQEIIYYRYIQELNFEEICTLMDLNYQSAQNLIQRSLKKIRDAYGSLEILILLISFLN